MSKLILHMENGTTLDIPLGQERVTIGRRADNDVCLPNLAVSGAHAVLVTILADSFLEDLGSTNGTLVNGTAIVKHFLRDRDEIDIGRHRLVYSADNDGADTSQYSARGMKATAGDLGEQVQMAKAITRFRRVDGDRRSQKSTRAGKDGAPVKSRVVRSALFGPTTVSDAIAARPISPAPIPPSPRSSLKVLIGPQAGCDFPLTKELTTIGRAGVQVALISQESGTFRLNCVEGERAPTVNGHPAAASGVDLSPGDVIEIAGSRLEFFHRG